MATYNWAYKSGIPNKYDIIINPSEDDVKPDNATYVALFGNDVTGNGSRMKPFKTIAKAYSVSSDQFIIMASGTYREGIIVANAANYLVGDGDVVIDFSYFLDYFLFRGNGAFFYNLKFIGSNSPILSGGYESRTFAYDCTFIKCLPTSNFGEPNGGVFKGCIFTNYSERFLLGFTNPIVEFENCTFNNMNRLGIGSEFGRVTNCIINRCNVTVGSRDTGLFRYSLFHQCNFKFEQLDSHPNIDGGVLYPEIPENFEYIDNIEILRLRVIEQFPLTTIALERCRIDDPKFNNISIGDFSLAFDSPAKNLSYFGTIVGARSIAYPIRAAAVESESDFDFSSIENLTIADDSIILTNPELDASVETIVKANLIGRELSEAPIYGFNADRNGQYIDSIADLSDILIGVGTDLHDLTPYIVEVASINLDGTIYQPGERFTTSGVLSFTSDGGGVCREIIEAPQRHTIMARFSNGGASKSVGDPLVVGYWYYPISGTINYNGLEYFQKSFKAIDTNSFTTPDSGVLVEAFTNEEYQHYEPGIAFSSNNVGNVRTGEILRGNGDPDYVRGTAFEFPINARFIQLKYIIRVKNLKP